MAVYKPLSPESSQKAIKYFFNLIFGQRPFELRVIPEKSQSQLGYLHIIIGIFALETGYDFQEAKAYYKAINSEHFFVSIQDKFDETKTVEHIKSCGDLLTDEMADTIENFRNYSSMEAGIYLPEPDKLKALQNAKINLIDNRVLLKIPKSIRF